MDQVPSPQINSVAVPQVVTCSQCHQQVRSSDYFCYNCGKNLKPKPLPTDIITQLLYYGGSILLPPMGFIWGFRYVRENNKNAKVIGIVCMVLTVIVLLVAVQATVQVINMVNEQVNSQMQNIMQF